MQMFPYDLQAMLTLIIIPVHVAQAERLHLMEYVGYVFDPFKFLYFFIFI